MKPDNTREPFFPTKIVGAEIIASSYKFEPPPLA